jgi:hypothetical protein
MYRLNFTQDVPGRNFIALLLTPFSNVTLHISEHGKSRTVLYSSRLRLHMTLVVASHFKRHALLHFYLKKSTVTRDYCKRSWSYISRLCLFDRHLSHCRGK